MRKQVSTIIRKADPWLGYFWPLRSPDFTDDANLVDGEGIYTSSDWEKTRQAQESAGGQNARWHDSDAAYVSHAIEKNPDKVLSAMYLAKRADLCRYPNIIELGCGEMIQAWVVSVMCPGVNYLATDFDRTVVSKCEKIKLLKNINKSVLDLTVDDLDLLRDFDLAICWAVDYALERPHLLRLMVACKQFGARLMLCSVNVTGPVGYLRCKLAGTAQKAKANQHLLRVHGWRRSLGSFRRLALQSGLRLQVLGRIEPYMCMLFHDD